MHIDVVLASQCRWLLFSFMRIIGTVECVVKLPSPINHSDWESKGYLSGWPPNHSPICPHLILFKCCCGLYMANVENKRGQKIFFLWRLRKQLVSCLICLVVNTLLIK